MLPPFYETNNFTECIKNKKTFCIADFQLYPSTKNSSNWKKIIHNNENYLMWDMTKIHRGICLPSTPEYQQEVNSRKLHLEALVNRNLSDYNLTSKAKIISCLENTAENSSDYFMLYALFFLIIMVIISTLLDYKYTEMSHSLKNIIQIFSLKKNWAKMTKTEGNEDFNKLKSIQGYRVLMMHMIIYSHSSLVLICSFFSNMEDVEKFLNLRIMEIIINISFMIINIFLLISSFLLTNQILNIIQKNGAFTIKDAIKLILKRYFRIVPSVVVVLCIHRSALYKKFVGYIGLRFWSQSVEACKISWLHTVLMINNYSYFFELCVPTTWYLSNDFQGYIIVVLIYYIISKFKLNKWKCTTGCLILSIVIYGGIIYSKDLDMVLKSKPGALNPMNFGYSDSYKLLYSGLHSTILVSFLGMIYGAFYHETKNSKLFDITLFTNAIYSLLTWGLPSVAIALTLCDFKMPTRALIGSVLKLIFVSGPGIGILGMAHGLGGSFKNIFENKYIIMISNISFSVYIINFLIWPFTGTTTENVYHYNQFLMLNNTVIHWVLSCTFGLVLALTVELPGVNITDLILSQREKTSAQYSKQVQKDKVL